MKLELLFMLLFSTLSLCIGTAEKKLNVEEGGIGFLPSDTSSDLENDSVLSEGYNENYHAVFEGTISPSPLLFVPHASSSSSVGSATVLPLKKKEKLRRIGRSDTSVIKKKFRIPIGTTEDRRGGPRNNNENSESLLSIISNVLKDRRSDVGLPKKIALPELPAILPSAQNHPLLGGATSKKKEQTDRTVKKLKKDTNNAIRKNERHHDDINTSNSHEGTKLHHSGDEKKASSVSVSSGAEAAAIDNAIVRSNSIKRMRNILGEGLGSRKLSPQRARNGRKRGGGQGRIRLGKQNAKPIRNNKRFRNNIIIGKKRSHDGQIAAIQRKLISKKKGNFKRKISSGDKKKNIYQKRGRMIAQKKKSNGNSRNSKIGNRLEGGGLLERGNLNSRNGKPAVRKLFGVEFGNSHEATEDILSNGNAETYINYKNSQSYKSTSSKTPHRMDSRQFSIINNNTPIIITSVPSRANSFQHYPHPPSQTYLRPPSQNNPFPTSSQNYPHPPFSSQLSSGSEFSIRRPGPEKTKNNSHTAERTPLETNRHALEELHRLEKNINSTKDAYASKLQAIEKKRKQNELQHIKYLNQKKIDARNYRRAREDHMMAQADAARIKKHKDYINKRTIEEGINHIINQSTDNRYLFGRVVDRLGGRSASSTDDVLDRISLEYMQYDVPEPDLDSYNHRDEPIIEQERIPNESIRVSNVNRSGGGIDTNSYFQQYGGKNVDVSVYDDSNFENDQLIDEVVQWVNTQSSNPYKNSHMAYGRRLGVADFMENENTNNRRNGKLSLLGNISLNNSNSHKKGIEKKKKNSSSNAKKKSLSGARRGEREGLLKTSSGLNLDIEGGILDGGRDGNDANSRINMHKTNNQQTNDNQYDDNYSDYNDIGNTSISNILKNKGDVRMSSAGRNTLLSNASLRNREIHGGLSRRNAKNKGSNISNSHYVDATANNSRESLFDRNRKTGNSGNFPSSPLEYVPVSADASNSAFQMYQSLPYQTGQTAGTSSSSGYVSSSSNVHGYNNSGVSGNLNNNNQYVRINSANNDHPLQRENRVRSDLFPYSSNNDNNSHANNYASGVARSQQISLPDVYDGNTSNYGISNIDTNRGLYLSSKHRSLKSEIGAEFLDAPFYPLPPSFPQTSNYYANSMPIQDIQQGDSEVRECVSLRDNKRTVNNRKTFSKKTENKSQENQSLVRTPIHSNHRRVINNKKPVKRVRSVGQYKKWKSHHKGEGYIHQKREKRQKHDMHQNFV